MVTNIKAWLQRPPRPAGLRYVTGDGEERELTLSGNGKQWADAENALLELGAVRCDALDKEGKVLRVAVLKKADGGGPSGSEIQDAAERQDRQKAKETASWALVLDAQGRRISEAFQAGADAASRGQDNLVQVVNILTAQWSATMQSLHNVSMNLAKLARQAGAADEGEPDNELGPAIQQMLGLAAMKMMGVPGGSDAPAAPANGTAKKEK